MDVKIATRVRDKGVTAASNSSVGKFQSFFFPKKPTPAPAPAPNPPPPVPPRSSAASHDGKSNGRPAGNPDGRSSPAGGKPARVSTNGRGHRGGNATGSGAAKDGEGEWDEDMYVLIEGAVPEEFAGRSWEGYLHHVDFIVALMHVGTSLIPKGLIKVRPEFVAIFFFLS